MVNRSDKSNSFSAQKSPSDGASLTAPGTANTPTGGWHKRSISYPTIRVGIR